MSDMAFEAVSKVNAGLSGRRFDTDVRETQRPSFSHELAPNPYFGRSPVPGPPLLWQDYWANHLFR